MKMIPDSLPHNEGAEKGLLCSMIKRPMSGWSVSGALAQTCSTYQPIAFCSTP
jgi:hypothetical protein